MNLSHILVFLCYFCFYLVESLECHPFSLASYNIHGLPMIMTFDETYKRMKEISEVMNTQNVDVINFQEDWTTHGNNILISNLEKYSWNQRLTEFTHTYSIFGSGLLQMSKNIPVNSSQIVYTDRYGYDDMWANKGFQIMRLGNIDIYNTHMDAGKTSGDSQAREKEINQLIEYATTWSHGRAIIIGGDTNLHASDVDSYDTLINSLNLTEITNQSHIDKFLYRNSTDTQLIPINVTIVENSTLSDHSMIYLNILHCSLKGCGEM